LQIAKIIFSSQFLDCEASRPKQFFLEEEKTEKRAIPFLGANLSPVTSSNVCKTAFEKAFNEQGLIKNMASEMVKAGLQIFGWASLDTLLYNNGKLFNGRRT
jgi:hypothetical protein